MNEKEKVSVPAQKSGTDLLDLIREELGEIADVRRTLCNAYEALVDCLDEQIVSHYKLSFIASSLSILNGIVKNFELYA